MNTRVLTVSEAQRVVSGSEFLCVWQFKRTDSHSHSRAFGAICHAALRVVFSHLGSFPLFCPSEMLGIS